MAVVYRKPLRLLIISVASAKGCPCRVATGTKIGGGGISKSVGFGGGSLYLDGRSTSETFAGFLFADPFFPAADGSGDSFLTFAVGFFILSSRTRVLGLRGEPTVGAWSARGRFCGIFKGGNAVVSGEAGSLMLSPVVWLYDLFREAGAR